MATFALTADLEAVWLCTRARLDDMTSRPVDDRRHSLDRLLSIACCRRRSIAPSLHQPVACKAAEVAFKVLKGKTVNFGCLPANPKYKCYSYSGQHACYPSLHGTLSEKDCESTCK